MMNNEVIIDGCNVAECNSFLNEYEFPNNLKGGYYKEKNLCECGVQGAESYPFFCKDNPNCYFKQLQRAKAELEQYKKSKQKILEKLKRLSREVDDDYECTHYKADCLLIEYINDKEIAKAYDDVGKGYL